MTEPCLQILWNLSHAKSKFTTDTRCNGQLSPGRMNIRGIRARKSVDRKKYLEQTSFFVIGLSRSGHPSLTTEWVHARGGHSKPIILINASPTRTPHHQHAQKKYLRGRKLVLLLLGVQSKDLF